MGRAVSVYNGGSLGKAWARAHHRVCRNKSTSEFEEVVLQGGHSEQKLEEIVAVWAGNQMTATTGATSHSAGAEVSGNQFS